MIGGSPGAASILVWGRTFRHLSDGASGRAWQTWRVFVLVVCAGNVCRSPLAERLLAAELGDGFVVASAGTVAPVGAPMSPHSAEQLSRLGGDPTGHRATRLTTSMAAGADLVLTMTEDLRTEVVQRSPAGLHRTFTWLEFAALATLPDLTPPDLTLPDLMPSGATTKQRVRSISAARARVGRSNLDVPDPIGKSVRVYAEVTDLITAGLPAVAAQIRRIAG